MWRGKWRVQRVSNGDSESHLKFANKNKLQYPLLCDVDDKLRKIFAVASMVSISFQSYKDVEIEKVNDFIDTYNYGGYDE